MTTEQLKEVNGIKSRLNEMSTSLESIKKASNYESVGISMIEFHVDGGSNIRFYPTVRANKNLAGLIANMLASQQEKEVKELQTKFNKFTGGVSNEQ